MPISLKFKKLSASAQIPKYQSEAAAGFDLHSVEEVTLRVGEVAVVATGLAVEIPVGFELQIRARSGLALKHGVFLVNGIGTIDADYRGEIKIIMSTCREQALKLEAGERIAQAVLARVERGEIQEVSELSETSRGAGGFGSTGRK